jgi:hypothetical protein
MLRRKLMIIYKGKSKENKKNKAGSKGFEPPTSGLEAQRYILAKPRALFVNSTAEYEMRLLR